MKKRIILMSLFAMFLAVTSVFGQGLTNSGINGQITDDKGESMPGATVLVVCRLHKPQCYAFGPSRVTSN